MTEYEIERKLKYLKDILDVVKKLKEDVIKDSNLNFLEAVSPSNKSSFLNTFDTILSEIKHFEYDDDEDIVFFAQVITEETRMTRVILDEVYLTNAEIEEYAEFVTQKIEEMSGILIELEFRPQERPYDHTKYKEEAHYG